MFGNTVKSLQEVLMHMLRAALSVLLAGTVGGALTLAAAGAGASLPGRWSLVEQRYGEGEHDFSRRGGEITVDFRLEEGRLAGTVSWEQGRGPWPAYPTPDGPAPVEITSRNAAPDLSWAEARYAVPASGPDGTRLLVHERWELASTDRAECTVEIAFERGGERRGKFVWHRVFEREAGR
jgi:hypothetical protein